MAENYNKMKITQAMETEQVFEQGAKIADKDNLNDKKIGEH